MRIALHPTSPVAVRAGRILLGERDLEELGLVATRPARSRDRRVRPAGDLDGYDVLVADDADLERSIRMARTAGIHCVLWRPADPAPHFEEFIAAGRSLVTGAGLAGGIAPALAGHEIRRHVDEPVAVTVAWTEPGQPLRRGEAVPFPEPVGSRWGRVRPSDGPYREIVVPVDGEWGGALAEVERPGGRATLSRVVGTADLAVHLEALALAAAAATAARDQYPPGAPEPAATEAFLAAALTAGLDIAAFNAD